MGNNENLPFSPPANSFICRVNKRDYATQTDSDGEDFSCKIPPESLTP